MQKHIINVQLVKKVVSGQVCPRAENAKRHAAPKASLTAKSAQRQDSDTQPGDEIPAQPDDARFCQQIEVIIMGMTERHRPVHKRIARVSTLVAAKTYPKPRM